MRDLLPWTLAFALLALPGCLSDGGADDDSGTSDPNDPDPPMGAGPKVIDSSGLITAGAGNEFTGSVRLGTASPEFSVPENATLLFVELAWDSPAVALDLCVHAPSDGIDAAGYPICGENVDGGSAGMPTNLVTYSRVEPEAGSGWIVDTFSDGPAANQEYVIKVTLFFGETAVPEGYSALT